ncbi:hypothetical protein QFC21_006402 [Naganishia friedmannii]|uniref:Uncharacterized protein n=1 Tax=Naganishia friedmannii TaxID=89922 RepID=A0ACC2V2Y4_9TREE|nr:hypothetical protein QFC21_006402 [Naganishia friedmannii]
MPKQKQTRKISHQLKKEEERDERMEGIYNEESLSKSYPLAPRLPKRRDLQQEALTAAWYPFTTGRRQTHRHMKWKSGKCDQEWLSGQSKSVDAQSPAPQDLVGEERQPIVFATKTAVKRCFGLNYPENLNLAKVAKLIPDDRTGDVLNNASGGRGPWLMPEWVEYMSRGTIPTGRAPSNPSVQDRIFNMACLEVSGTKLEKEIDLPFLQRELDPLERFKGLKENGSETGSIYIMSSKAGSFTPWHLDATAEVHWLCVVKGEKWVYTLPPTPHNTAMMRLAEKGDYTPKDALVVAGGWVDEYNLASHIEQREHDLNIQTMKRNRYPQFERICWMLAEEFGRRWATEEMCRGVSRHMSVQISRLRRFVADEKETIVAYLKGKKGLSRGKISVGSLPYGYRDTEKWNEVQESLKQGYLNVLRANTVEVVKDHKKTRKWVRSS